MGPNLLTFGCDGAEKGWVWSFYGCRGVWAYNKMVMGLYRDLFTRAMLPNPGHEAEPSVLDLATWHE